MPENIQLKDIIKFEKGNFVIASDSGFSIQDVNDLLAQTASRAGVNAKDQLLAIATTVIEPIDQALRYITVFTEFYREIGIGPLEDWSIPVENLIMGLGFQVHSESEVFFVRPSFEWTRPTLNEYSAGVEMPWKLMQRAGWNLLSRMMERATDALARQIDAQARAGVDASILATAGHAHTQAGTTLTKAAVDAVIKAANALGFPMSRAAINAGTVTDMAGWSTGTFSTQTIPEAEARDLLQRLYLGNYGGIDWYSNPFVTNRFVYFSGPSSATGYHIVRGSVNAASDVDIHKGIDLHAIRSAEHAFYIGNPNNIRRLEITGLI